MKQTMTVCDTLEQVSHATEAVKYVPHGPKGQWPSFQQWCDDTTDWDITTTLRALVAYLLDNPGTPVVITMFHDDCQDEAPKYRILCYDITYDQLLKLDAKAQASWFNIVIDPHDALFNVTLNPTRSLMKLLYKQVN